MMKKYILILPAAGLVLSSLAQTDAPLRERICLQTDKTLYLAGELVWLKAITTDPAGRPIELSKLGYVELLDDSAPQVQLKVELKKGVGEGSFYLPLSLPTGNYRLLSYTRYMRNEGEAAYYERLLPVINPFMPPPAFTDAPDAQASPDPSEGGEIFSSLISPPSEGPGEARSGEAGEPVGETLLSVSITGPASDTIPQVQVELEWEDGAGESSFYLPLSLPAGHYRLGADTRTMRREAGAVKPVPPVPTVPLPSQEEAIPIALYTDREVYPPRTAGELRIEGLPDDLHTLSVSIAGLDTLWPTASGSLEAWKHRLAGQTLPPFDEQEYMEYEGHIFSGKLIDQATGLPPAAGEKPEALLGFVGDRTALFNGQLDGQGEVRFFTGKTAGLYEVAATVLSASPGRYRLDIQSPFAAHTYTPLPAPELPAGGSEALLQRSVGLQVLQSYMADSLNRTAAGETQLFPWEPDWRYLLDEYTRFPTMAEVVTEFMPGLRFRRTGDSYALSVLTEERAGFTQARSLALLDGIPLADHGLIYHYNPLLLKEVEVYKGKYVFGGAVFDGIAVFKTYTHDYPGLSLNASTQIFRYEGTQPPRLFYSPATGRKPSEAAACPTIATPCSGSRSLRRATAGPVSPSPPPT